MEEFQIQATVDRIEADKAVLLLATPEGEVPVDWPLALLPSGIGEGGKLDFCIKENKQAEDDARQRISDLLDKLTGGSD
ncbi:MAG: DUF3006 domain-containing protein [Firmicutes bacterium]|mgnify:CR=1 FL=1|nr:DUF3006 domain-containing protein [Bacillota bacterium]